MYSAFFNAATGNIQRMSELHALRSGLGPTIFSCLGVDAAHTGLKCESIDTIITSPPYCGSQKYVRTMKLELILAGYPPHALKTLDRQTLGTEAVSRRVAHLNELLTGDCYVDRLIRSVYSVNPVRARMASDYSKYLVTFANECRRVLRPGGHLIVTLGRSTLAGVPFRADQIFRSASQRAGLEVIATLIDRIPSRGLLTQRHGTAGRIDHEFVLWLRSPCLSIPPCTDTQRVGV